jgi:hypothetical protein
MISSAQKERVAKSAGALYLNDPFDQIKEPIVDLR